ncbi:MAG: hypothetical protein FWD27_07285 [Coriobacteriia bacterium]|nr:hypothetical protein [Coriobacteriia bacterium]
MKKLNQDQLRNVGGGYAVYDYRFVQSFSREWRGYSTQVTVRHNGHPTTGTVYWRSPYTPFGYDGKFWCRVL